MLMLLQNLMFPSNGQKNSVNMYLWMQQWW